MKRRHADRLSAYPLRQQLQNPLDSPAPASEHPGYVDPPFGQIEYRAQVPSGAQQNGCLADAATPMQVLQGLQRRKQADLRLGPLGRFRGLLQSAAVLGGAGGRQDHESLGHGGRARVYEPHGHTRRHLRCQSGHVYGPAQRVRHMDGQDAFDPLSQPCIQESKVGQRRLRRGRTPSGLPQPTVDIGGGHVHPIAIAPSLPRQPKGNPLYLVLLHRLRGQACGAVGDNGDTGHPTTPVVAVPKSSPAARKKSPSPPFFGQITPTQYPSRPPLSACLCPPVWRGRHR